MKFDNSTLIHSALPQSFPCTEWLITTIHTCGMFQKCDISAAGSVARLQPDPMTAIFVLSSPSWENTVLCDRNLTHCRGIATQTQFSEHRP